MTKVTEHRCPYCCRSVDVLYEFYVLEGVHLMRVFGCEECSKREMRYIQEMAAYDGN